MSLGGAARLEGAEGHRGYPVLAAATGNDMAEVKTPATTTSRGLGRGAGLGFWRDRARRVRRRGPSRRRISPGCLEVSVVWGRRTWWAQLRWMPLTLAARSSERSKRAGYAPVATRRRAGWGSARTRLRPSQKEAGRHGHVQVLASREAVLCPSVDCRRSSSGPVLGNQYEDCQSNQEVSHAGSGI